MSQTDFTQEREHLHRHEQALNYLDKILKEAPLFAPFEPFSLFKILNIQEIDEETLHRLTPIVKGMFQKLNYAETDGFWIWLTNLGREAKKKGGYFAHRAYLDKVETRNDKKEDFFFNRRWATFLLPIMAIVISLGSLLYNVYKGLQSSPPPQLHLNLNMNLDSFKSKIYIDTSLKRRPTSTSIYDSTEH